MADKDITPKIKALPNMNLQTDRLMEKHQFHCPKCGKVSFTNFIMQRNKSVSYSDIVIHCDVCGDTVLDIRGKDMRSFIKGTDTEYIQTVWRDAAIKKMNDHDKTDLKGYVEACKECAYEMRLECAQDNTLFIPYLNAMFTLLKDLKENDTKNLEYACIQTLECNSVSKYELMSVMLEIYEIALKNEEKLPEPLFIKIKAEYTILHSAFTGEMREGGSLTYDSLMECVDAFDKMSDSDSLVYPYTGAEACQMAVMCAANNDEKKMLKDAAKRMIEEYENARRLGAPFGRTQMMSCLGAYSKLATKRTNPFKKALNKAKLWNDDSFYIGYASAAYAEYVFKMILCEDGEQLVNHDPEYMKEAVEYATAAIEALEKEIDMDKVGYWLVTSYCIRGIILRDNKDLDLALKYTDFFKDIGAISDDGVSFITAMIVLNTKLASPIQRRAMKLAGYPIF